MNLIKIYKIVFFTLALGNFLFSGSGTAQIKLSVNDIQKIKLVDYAGHLGGFRNTKFEIVNEDNQWKCFQTYQQYQYRPSKDSALYRKLTTNKRLFVKNIDIGLLQKLLKSVSELKPKFKPEYIDIKPAKLIAQVDSQYIKGLPDFDRKVYLNLLNNKKVLNSSLIALQESSWTDDWPFCQILIVKKNNDTVNINTGVQLDYMLPWKLNGVKTYDVSINDFS